MKHVTLLFLRREGEILLAMKKRRFGAGKWNGVGGKVEPGESFEQAAIRECEEEIGVTPRLLRLVGEMQFTDPPDAEHYAHIYVTYDWEGEPHETEEMAPQWFAEADIPYDTMWIDDIHWIPLMLEGKLFKGNVRVENDTLVECEFHEVDSL